MALTFNWIKNDVLRPIIMLMQMDSELLGCQEEGASMLTRQLQRRFGVVPEWAREKTAKAEPTALEKWSLRFVDAQSLDDVFMDKV